MRLPPCWPRGAGWNGIAMTDPVERIKLDEGYRRYPYRCSEGVLTIGYGRNIDPDHGGQGLDEIEASFLLRNNLSSAEIDLKSIFPGWRDIGYVRQAALLNMRFQLGASGFRGFRLMIRHANDGQWIRAAREATLSKWARQTPERAYRVAMEIRDGVALP